MDKMIFTVLNGMKVVEQRQANTFNELANVNTVGFKKSFNSAVMSGDLLAENSLNTRAYPSLQTINKVDIKPGPFQRTGNPFDLYINERGLLAVQDADGNEVYTRRGDIKVTDNGVLTTGTGNLVLGDDGPITLPPTNRAEVSPDGTISILEPGAINNELTPVARLKLVNPGDNLIQIRSDGLYETQSKELLPADALIKVTTGGLEGSAVNPIEAMVNMIRDSRAYEMNVRVIKNAKEVSTASASMMRLDG